MNHEATGPAVHHHSSQPGEFVKDPVCGMNVDPKSAAHKYSFAGQPYFFCSQNCLASSGASQCGTLACNPRRRMKREPVPLQLCPLTTYVPCIRKSCAVSRETARSAAWLSNRR